MVTMTFIFFSHGWNLLGIVMASVTLGGAVGIWDIIDMNSEKDTPTAKRSLRAAYFNSLSLKEKEQFMIKKELKIKELIKK